MLGAFFGYFVHLYFPDITAGPGAYALVAMGGLVAGTTRAPVTAIIIVFELTITLSGPSYRGSRPESLTSPSPATT